ncbi:amino acid adenylation domain-containing protein [Streptomyces sp. NPDC098781]|uniref:amino acid adenylation domain-containing protein n=1 Tax=Streptomyces sp. NPDC098781 TaxID=3366097 RepID=UPI003804FA27
MNVPLPELIAAQAARTPEAVAVVAAGPTPDRLSYAGLRRRSDELARRLRALGVGPGTVVGVCLRRGTDLVATLLAVWQTGAAYLPLDPDHPTDRLTWMLTDAQTPVVITDRTARPALGTHVAVPLLTLDEALADEEVERAEGPATPRAPQDAGRAERRRSAEHPVEPVEAGSAGWAGDGGQSGGDVTDGSAPAYVLYTSGSTGRPKGVVVPHAGIANRVRWLVARHGLGPGDRVLQKTTVGFDAAGLELFAPLVGGGTVVLAPHGAEREPAALLDAVARERITVLQGVPSVLRALADLPTWDGCEALRLIFSAGEPLHAELCHRLLARVPHAEIWNTYGPTECSVDITEHRFDPALTRGPVPIGRPIGGMRALVLDPRGEPVAPGGEGELYAGGVGVALGYLGRPARTAERFVPDPSGPPGARLYSTGDRVRLLPDGTLEYLGRLDHQIKVNGVRIEPGEVEAALVAHPSVAAAVVGTVTGSGGTRRLAAWIEVRGTAPSPGDLRAFLREGLPDTLIPTVFVPLAALPLTPSGKTDRAALSDPSTTGRPGGAHPAEPTPPRTPAERAVADIWAALLGLPPGSVGAHDDFFQLGGSSLQLTDLLTRLREQAGLETELRELFTTSTVAAQAALPPVGTTSAPPPDTAAPGPVPRGAGLPLSPGQQGLWLLEQLDPGGPEWTTPQWVRLPAEWSERTVRTALERLAERHEILRTRYALRDEGPVQIVDPPGHPVELRVAEARDAAALGELTAAELARGFDLVNGPVWRALLIRTADGVDEDGPAALLLTAHHLACDGWSSVLLDEDLRALGAALHEGREPHLPPVPVQYADHAVRQNHRLTPETIRRELAHWSAVLDGVTPLELPSERPRPAARDGRGGLRTRVVDARLAERVADLGRGAGATLHQTLLTAFAVLLTRLTGRTDLTVGMPVAGRHRPEVARTVGCFLNNLVLRCRTDTEGDVLEALASVRDTVLDALSHQELPFDRLVQELESGRDLSRTPLYQVMFDFHEEGRTGTACSPARLTALRDGWQSARTDLTFVVLRRTDGSLLVRAEYAKALFDAETVDRLTDCWARLLESFVTDPAVPLAELALLPEDEHARLLALGAPGPDADTDDGPDVCGYTAFEASALRAPDAVAVVCGDEQWPYGRLLDRTAALARRLRALGAGPERTVAVLLPRVPDLVAAPLAVWRAGAVHLPLDRAAPDERLAHILSDARVTAVLTDTEGARRLGPYYTGPLVVTDQEDGDETGVDDTGVDDTGVNDAEPTALERDPARLAYLMYTSGTTGRPKGVGVEHRAILSVLRAGRAHLRFGEGADDAWLALAPPTFDIVFTELVMPLLAGGRVVLARDEETADHAALLGLIDRHGVTHLQAAFPTWRMLVDAGLGSRPLVGQTGGQPCPPALARDLAGRLKRFVNEYGLTETAIAATRWEADSTAETVAIGRPYGFATARVLDPFLRPVPQGTVGELCIGGRGLFRGYAGRPAETAERLVPDPYGPPGARLLRTGDLARTLPDGTLVFAGRADGQVKIRGRRVETGEVQAVLAEHPAVGEAVVVTHGTGDNARLVAYCVPAARAELPPPGALLDHCARRLPDYMLPTLVVRLDALPVTRHGKVDTAALPAPGLSAVADDEPYVAPDGVVEETIARIWSEVLTSPDGAGPRVGTRNGFFRLGGDSVRAARVIARVQQEYGVALPLRVLFDRPTVAALAEAVEEAVRAEIASLSDAELAAAHRELHT